MFLKISQNYQENTSARVSFLMNLQACNFIKKETLAQMFSFEFYEIFQTKFLKKTSGGCFYGFLINDFDHILANCWDRMIFWSRWKLKVQSCRWRGTNKWSLSCFKSMQACNQEFFRAGQVSENKATSINI